MTRDLLEAWERGGGQGPAARALVLLGIAVPDASPDALRRASVGTRDAWLLALRERLFGSRIECLMPCSHCGESIEVAFDTGDVRADAATAPFQIAVDGKLLTCRAPDGADLLAIERAADIPAARALLLARCVEGAPSLSPAAAAAIEAAMAAHDPQAEILINLSCPACGTGTQIMFDIVRQLWSDLDEWARGLLREVDALARAYHWSEASILRLSGPRRAWYLALAGAA